jgi:integration host factor subunit beta
MDQTAPRDERPRKGTRPERTTTKADLVDEVARAAELTRKQAEAVVEAVFEGIIASLQDGQKIELRGFGSFKIRRRGARLARNPKKSGVKVMVPPKRVPYFKPGKKLKELLNEAAGTPATDDAAGVSDATAG